MNDITNISQQLAKSRALAIQLTNEADKLSSQLAKVIRLRMMHNNITLKCLSEVSKIPMSRIVNWLCGSSTHCIPPEVITTLFNAASKPTKPKKRRTL